MRGSLDRQELKGEMEPPQEEDLSGALSDGLLRCDAAREWSAQPWSEAKAQNMWGLATCGCAGHVVPTKDTLISIANWNVRAYATTAPVASLNSPLNTSAPAV